MSVGEVAQALGLPYDTVRYWRFHPAARKVSADRCPRCRTPPTQPDDPAAYAYLLGLYLGDGHLVVGAGTPKLRIACAERYPDLISACEQAMTAVLAATTHRARGAGYVSVESYGVHWPCLFPQHGPGLKHERRIELAPWQRDVVAAHPGSFLRGLFHSDGCRTVNRITVRGRRYAYPRYLFTNRSADILDLCQWALDQLGIAWRRNRADSLSVARREAVAALDHHVGPKR